MKTLKLPQAGLDTIDKYLHMPLGGKLVQCPYFKNRLGIRAGVRVFLGKGSPEEIIEETKVLAQRHKIDLKNLNESQIREFVEKNNLGIDCSGFIAQVLKSIDYRLVRQIASKNILINPLRAIIAKIRPIENISVKILTNERNSIKLDNWHEVRPEDIVRTRKGHHALLVTEVKRTDYGDLKELNYFHSTSFYGDKHGVRQGRVKIIYPKENLQDQDWQEQDNKGRNYAHDGLLEDDGENGIYRLKTLNSKL